VGAGEGGRKEKAGVAGGKPVVTAGGGWRGRGEERGRGGRVVEEMGRR